MAKKKAKKKAAKKKTVAKKKAAKAKNPEPKYEGGVYVEAGVYYPIKYACLAVGKSPTWTRINALDSEMGKVLGDKFLVISEAEVEELRDMGAYDLRT